MADVGASPVPEFAITLRQPWASLVVWGAKRVETRGKRCSYRGLLGVHASKTFGAQEVIRCREEPFRSVLRAHGVEDPYMFPKGALLGSAVVVGCEPTDGLWLADLSDQESAFGDYSSGRWGWVLECAREFEAPIPMSGNQATPWRLKARDRLKALYG